MLCEYCLFLQIEASLLTNSRKSLYFIFPTAFAHFAHSVPYGKFSQYFTLSHLCLFLWSVIFVITILIVLGHHKPHPWEMLNFFFFFFKRALYPVWAFISRPQDQELYALKKKKKSCMLYSLSQPEAPEIASLIDKCFVFWLFYNWPALPPLSTSHVAYFLRHNDTEIRTVNNPTLVSECSSERIAHLSL